MTIAEIEKDHDMYLTFLCYPKGAPPLSDVNALGRSLFDELWDERYLANIIVTTPACHGRVKKP